MFRLQYIHNKVYKSYVDALGIDLSAVTKIENIPFLPIGLFKTHAVITTSFTPQAVFESSGTTGKDTSRHYVKDLTLYEKSFRRTFKQFYGPPQNWCVLALLPGYLERQHSSLVYMADRLIKESEDANSGFYLNDHESLSRALIQNEAAGRATLLIGVTFALLDFAAKYPQQLRHTVVMETGGMKGRRQEMTREEVHAFLRSKLEIAAIHSEYGMTELLSQAYSKGDGIYQCPPWMKVLVREENDPLAIVESSQIRRPVTGLINIIDLANLYSCPFIATDDAGRLHCDDTFEVLGRRDVSDLRGCSLLSE
jgi:Acyl-protein synthetase, LuxE